MTHTRQECIELICEIVTAIDDDQSDLFSIGGPILWGMFYEIFSSVATEFLNILADKEKLALLMDTHRKLDRERKIAMFKAKMN